MRRSTHLVRAVEGAIKAAEAADTNDRNAMIGTLLGVSTGLRDALAAYRARPEGEPEVKAAKAKKEA